MHREVPEDCRKYSALKGCTQNLTGSEFLHKGSNLKGSYQTHLLILERLSERQEATGICPGYRDAGESFWGSVFYHKDADAGKHHFGVLSLFSRNFMHPPVSHCQSSDPLVQDVSYAETQPCPPASKQLPHKVMHWQPDILKVGAAYHCAHSSGPTTREGATQPI